jgi:protein ImuA
VAAQQHGKLLFVVRGPEARNDSSPAPLRLALSLAPGPLQRLQVEVFKRRGPPLVQPLALAARPARLQALLAASRARAQRRQQAAEAVPVQKVVHALARLAANDAA